MKTLLTALLLLTVAGQATPLAHGAPIDLSRDQNPDIEEGIDRLWAVPVAWIETVLDGLFSETIWLILPGANKRGIIEDIIYKQATKNGEIFKYLQPSEIRAIARKLSKDVLPSSMPYSRRHDIAKTVGLYFSRAVIEKQFRATIKELHATNDKETLEAFSAEVTRDFSVCLTRADGSEEIQHCLGKFGASAPYRMGRIVLRYELTRNFQDYYSEVESFKGLRDLANEALDTCATTNYFRRFSKDLNAAQTIKTCIFMGVLAAFNATVSARLEAAIRGVIPEPYLASIESVKANARKASCLINKGLSDYRSLYYLEPSDFSASLLHCTRDTTEYTGRELTRSVVFRSLPAGVLTEEQRMEVVLRTVAEGYDRCIAAQTNQTAAPLDPTQCAPMIRFVAIKEVLKRVLESYKYPEPVKFLSVCFDRIRNQNETSALRCASESISKLAFEMTETEVRQQFDTREDLKKLGVVLSDELLVQLKQTAYGCFRRELVAADSVEGLQTVVQTATRNCKAEIVREATVSIVGTVLPTKLDAVLNEDSRESRILKEDFTRSYRKCVSDIDVSLPDAEFGARLETCLNTGVLSLARAIGAIAVQVYAPLIEESGRQALVDRYHACLMDKKNDSPDSLKQIQECGGELERQIRLAAENFYATGSSSVHLLNERQKALLKETFKLLGGVNIGGASNSKVLDPRGNLAPIAQALQMISKYVADTLLFDTDGFERMLREVPPTSNLEALLQNPIVDLVITASAAKEMRKGVLEALAKRKVEEEKKKASPVRKTWLEQKYKRLYEMTLRLTEASIFGKAMAGPHKPSPFFEAVRAQIQKLLRRETMELRIDGKLRELLFDGLILDREVGGFVDTLASGFIEPELEIALLEPNWKTRIGLWIGWIKAQDFHWHIVRARPSGKLAVNAFADQILYPYLVDNKTSHDTALMKGREKDLAKLLAAALQEE